MNNDFYGRLLIGEDADFNHEGLWNTGKRLHDGDFRLSYINEGNFNYTGGCDADFRFMNLQYSSFIYATYPNAQFEGANIKNVAFDGVILRGADFFDATLENCTFDWLIEPDSLTNLKDANFYNATLKNCSFKGTNLNGACFQNAKLENCTFERCDINEGSFRGATFIDTTFYKCEGYQDILVMIPDEWEESKIDPWVFRKGLNPENVVISCIPYNATEESLFELFRQYKELEFVIADELKETVKKPLEKFEN